MPLALFGHEQCSVLALEEALSDLDESLCLCIFSQLSKACNKLLPCGLVRQLFELSLWSWVRPDSRSRGAPLRREVRGKEPRLVDEEKLRIVVYASRELFAGEYAHGVGYEPALDVVGQPTGPVGEVDMVVIDGEGDEDGNAYGGKGCNAMGAEYIYNVPKGQSGSHGGRVVAVETFMLMR